jgi:transcriptional regulator with XRE-family HTH domain
MNPGDLLAAVLKARGIEKTVFAQRLGTTYTTVNRWTKNLGFTPKKQRKAAAELGLEANYFDMPTRDEHARTREAYRREVFGQFLATDFGRDLVENDPGVVTALNAAPIPVGRLPTVKAYMAFALVYTGQLDADDAAASVRLNEQLAKQKKRPPKKGPKKP